MERFQIFFASDDGYIQHLCVAICSMLKNTKNYNLDIFIIFSDFSEDAWNSLRNITDSYPEVRLFKAKIDDKQISSLVTGNHFNKVNYYRLFIPDFSNQRKVLYLDADIVVKDDVTKLFKEDVEDYYLAAVDNTSFSRHEELGMDLSADYFNSGVMLINIDKWKSHQIPLRVIQFVSSNSDVVRFVDQCGLNAIVNGKWKKLPIRWNFQSAFFESNDKAEIIGKYGKEYYFSNLDFGIIHYTGSSKPWHYCNRHKLKKEYWNYLEFTDFRGSNPEGRTIKNIIKKYFLIKKFS